MKKRTQKQTASKGIGCHLMVLAKKAHPKELFLNAEVISMKHLPAFFTNS